MHNIDMKKVLVLLIVLIVYVNYQNYIKPDMKKLHREVRSLETNIQREIDTQKQGHTKESLLLDYDKITFNAKEFSYSKAMGEMQNQINESAKGGCVVKSIKWAQVPNTKLWYDKLRMNVRLTCTPNELLEMTNSLKAKETLYNVENFMAEKDRKKPHLRVSIQLVGFRTHNEAK